MTLPQVMRIRQNTTAPALRILATRGGGAIDFTLATSASIVAKTAAGATVFTDAAPTKGKGWLQHTWSAGDTATAQTLYVVATATWADGSVEAFPVGGALQVEVTEA